MRILGLNAAYHESAVALVEDGRVLTALEEERLSRVRHAKPARVDTAGELPWRALRASLADLGWEPGSLDGIAFSLDPAARFAAQAPAAPGPDEDPGAIQGPADGPPRGYGTRTGELRLRETLEAIPRVLADGLGVPGLAERFRFLPHHPCHAASGFYASGWDEAAILVVDGIGEAEAVTWYRGRDGRLEPLGSHPADRSPGFLWESVTGWLGLRPMHDESKVMALAAFGDPERFGPWFRDRVGIDDRGGLRLDPGFYGFRQPGHGELGSRLGPGRRPGEPLRWQGRGEDRLHADVAAALQQATEELLAGLAGRALAEAGSRRLVLAGGVALNCVANGRLAARLDLDDLWVTPAPHDAGTALGAAWLLSAEAGIPPRPCLDPRLGPRLPDAAALRARLEAAGLRVRPTTPEALADALASGRIVASYRGRAEFGPRALGHRSFLADPRDAGIARRLSVSIKHREEFRPLAPVLTREAADRLFESGGRLPAAPQAWMAMTLPASAEGRARIPGALHVDGTSRIQVLEPAFDRELHALLEAFGRQTGVACLLNTSFNVDGPMVETPEDAVRTFAASGADLLWLGPTVAERA